MKRKIKQWWLTLPPLSTKQTTISHFAKMENPEKLATTRRWKQHKHIVTVDKLISYLYTDIKCDLLYMCVCIDISDEVYSSGFLRQHSL